MGWLIVALVALLALSIAALVAPAVFGPVLAGAAPLLLVIALIGLGGVWWRRVHHPVEPETTDEAVSGSEVVGEDERVET